MRFTIFLFLLFIFTISFSQNERGLARDGNMSYGDSLYSEAEIQYKKSLSKDSHFDEAKFNLSNTLFKQERYHESIDLLNDIIKTTNDSVIKSEAYYNMGNNYMMMGEEGLQEAINAYQNCLKINPSDEEARHNLSKALRRLVNQNSENNNQNQDKDEDKKESQNSGQTDSEDEQSQENKENNENNNQSNEGGQSNGDEKKEGDSDGSVLEDELSRQDIDRILEALDREEKEVQEKVRKINFSNQKKKKIEKDW